MSGDHPYLRLYFVLVAVLALGVTVWRLATGRIPGLRGAIFADRRVNPTAYWLHMAWHVAIVVGCAYGALYLGSRVAG